MEAPNKMNTLNIDEMLSMVGEYGPFQMIVNLMFCITMFPVMFHLLIIYFATNSPSWRCVSNSTTCPLHNMTFNSKDNARCAMPRAEWEYVTPRDYSLVTEFDLVCDKEFLIEFPTSVLFFGFMFGAIILGWCADNFGRKRVHYLSLAVVMLLGFLSIFVGNIYGFIACRFVIGFFLHGTFPQLYIMISEIVGNKHRAFSNTVMSVSVGFALPLLALKAYLISRWKVLVAACTLPYLFILLFYKFVPESVRYLRVKGRVDEAMLTFKRIAYWNKTELLPNVTIETVPENITNHKSSPLDLFRTTNMAYISIVLSFSAFTNSLAVYCLLLAAGELTGHMYRDFVIISILDIPVGLITTPLLNYFGRKKTSMLYVLIGSVSCIALGLTPRIGRLMILRLIFGMFGTACITGSGITRTIWALELYPTHVRGEGIGLGQLLKKIGAICSAWVDKDLSKSYGGGAFILIGVLSFLSFCLQAVLPETKGINTADTERELANNNNNNNISDADK